jgi:hypothetical protein
MMVSRANVVRNEYVRRECDCFFGGCLFFLRGMMLKPGVKLIF